MILLFAWWKEGMDNGYPNYEPDPALGGTEKLKKAITEINSLGGIVILYANGHLIDVSTDFYKKAGIKYTMKDIEKNESRWGNEYASISEEDIDALRNGNVIYIFVNEEYGLFIALRKD